MYLYKILLQRIIQRILLRKVHHPRRGCELHTPPAQLRNRTQRTLVRLQILGQSPTSLDQPTGRPAQPRPGSCCPVTRISRLRILQDCSPGERRTQFLDGGGVRQSRGCFRFPAVHVYQRRVLPVQDGVRGIRTPRILNRFHA